MKESDKPLKVAVLGCGSVGSQVVRLLEEQSDDLAARVGAPVELVGVGGVINGTLVVGQQRVRYAARRIASPDGSVVSSASSKQNEPRASLPPQAFERYSTSSNVKVTRLGIAPERPTKGCVKLNLSTMLQPAAYPISVQPTGLDRATGQRHRLSYQQALARFADLVPLFQSHRDDKGASFHWEKSQVNDPAHALRLLLLIALAMVLAASQGSVVQKAGRRRQLDPHRRRRLSVVQLGLRWLRYALNHDLQGLLSLGRLYLYPD